MKIDAQKKSKFPNANSPHGFVPHRLEIKGKPELNNFPLNVLFVSYKHGASEIIVGSAIYNPDFASFKAVGDIHSMLYRNAYGDGCRLRIYYDTNKKSWSGEKTINDVWIGTASGPQWNMFFINFTLLGLQNGERCLFETLD